MEPSGQGYFVPIACRFVPHDQWLVTHLHTSWKISDVKLWLLAKCLPTLFTPVPPIPRQRFSQRRRPVSPITFASREEVSDDEDPPADDPYLEYGDYFNTLTDPDDPILSDKYKFLPRNSPGASSSDIIPKANTASPCSEPSSYVLLSYSTGQILEDQWSFGYYAMHPNELLELHPYPYLIKLPRTTSFEYCQPYFEGRAWVMRLVDNSGTANRSGERSGKLGDIVDLEKEKALKKRRKYVSWQDRWIVIREGQFHICKDRNECVWLDRVEMSSMVSIRGEDYLKDFRKTNTDIFAGSKDDFTERRVICVKFRREQQSSDISAWFRRGSRDATASEESRRGVGVDNGNLEDEGDDSRAGDNVVFFLHMHNDTAFDSILRVLHRDSHSAPSSFFRYSARRRSPRRRSYSPISFASVSPGQSPNGSPEPELPSRTQSPDTPTPSAVRYPEWRLAILRKAWRAGLGDVGHAMELARFGDAERDDVPSDFESGLPEVKQHRGRSSNDKWGIVVDSDSDGNSDSESEREWEGWEADHVSARARRVILPVAGLAGWRWGDGMQASPSADYSFPPKDGPSPSRKSLTVPKHTLYRYSSVDSLMRHHTQIGTAIRYGPIVVNDRAESPSPGVGRSRPRSPLAGEHDGPEYFGAMEPGLAATTHQQFIPDVAYPTPRTSHESGLRSASGPTHSAQRNPVPLSLAMTTITSTVTAGDPPPVPPKKSKGKGKAKAVIEPASRLQQRKRSLTAQPASPVARSTTAESPQNGSGTNTQAVVEGSVEPVLRQGKTKLALSFAQVTAMGPASASASSSTTLVPPPISATSTSSFESPRFAHPEDSD